VPIDELASHSPHILVSRSQATGGRPGLPPIPGLKDAPYTTNENLFNLEVLPPRMIILGVRKKDSRLD
jgi:pyruvate/2-oxoglutarate dehydrogenase complex dihydrolipoamide dehydrogenase (E3) component